MHAIAKRAPILAIALGAATLAHADPTSGVDVALFRPSYDSNGVFAVEGARLMPVRDLVFKLLFGYGKSPIDVAVPGIGPGAGDTQKDPILDYLVTLDMVFGMTITDHVAIGFDVAAYRTSVGIGYGQRGRYAIGGAITQKSTGLISLRPLSNIDPSASPDDPSAYLGDELAGPLDARVGLKLGLYSDSHIAVAAIGSVFLPFGDDNMLLGDRNFVYEPKLAFEWRPDRFHQTRIVANGALRFRERTVLEAYDVMDSMATDANAKVFLDIGSEAVFGAGAMYELTPRTVAAIEAQAFVPLPDTLSFGTCHRYNGLSCSSLTSADYWPGAKYGDLTTIATLGMMLRVTADVTANLMIGTGQIGARGDDFRVTTGIVWSPQPLGAAGPGHGDRDGDGIPDSRDQCPNEPEDKDGFQDEDGCPDPDNDHDGIPDATDKCPNDPEDKDGFEDDDGCPDLDNDGDGIPDATDKCPNDAETFNGFQDEDGCPDVRVTSGPEERPDRIDLKGQPIAFDRAGKLTPAAKTLLGQVAAIIKQRKLTVRVEVHVPLGTKSANANAIAQQKKKDKQVAQKRATEILDFFVAQGVPQAQIQAVGIGSERPLGTANPGDAVNERVDFIKAQQGGGTP